MWKSSSSRMGKRIDAIPDEFVNAFESHSWPGNIRELQNVIERAVILSNDGLLPNLLRPTRGDSVVAFPASRTLRESERLLILGALEATGWLVGRTVWCSGTVRDEAHYANR